MIEIHLCENEVQEMRDLAKAIAIAKLDTPWYGNDMMAIVNRYCRGLLGELAVEKWLGIPVVERVADKYTHNHPDIKIIGWGVKTYRTDLPPLVEKKQKYPQIICRCDDTVKDCKEATVYIEGIATPQLIMNNLDDEQIQDPAVRRKGYKSAFVGLDKLIPVNEKIKSFILGGNKQ